jgi:small-conductance mechanosensitive channel
MNSPAWAQELPAAPDMESLTLLSHMIRWGGIAMSIGIVAGAWLLSRFAKRLAENLGEVLAERRLLIHKLGAFFQFGIYIATILVVVLLSFRFSTQVLAVLGGTAAVAMGFALKDLAASVVAGVMVMFDRPFQVGDRISFGGQYGDVLTIGLRSVKLRTLDDNTVTIPNNMLLSEITSCGNYGKVDMQTVIDFHIGVDQDVHLARDVVREQTATSRYVFLKKPINVLVSQVIVDNYVALRLRLRAHVFDTKYEKEFESDVTLRILEAFDENGIRPPAILHRQAKDLKPLKSRGLSVARQSA